MGSISLWGLLRLTGNVKKEWNEIQKCSLNEESIHLNSSHVLIKIYSGNTVQL